MLKRSLLMVALALAPLYPAQAEDGCDGGCRGGRHYDRGHDRHYDRGHRGWDRGRDYQRSRTVVSFNYGTGPYYYPRHRYYYRPATVIYSTPPAVVQPDVIYIDNNNSRIVDSSDGRYCREYQSKVRIGNNVQDTYGTACMQPDGSWEIIS